MIGSNGIQGHLFCLYLEGEINIWEGYCYCRNKSNFISNPVYMQDIPCEKGFEAVFGVGEPLLRNGPCLSAGKVCVGGRLEVCTRVANALLGHSRCKRERGGF